MKAVLITSAILILVIAALRPWLRGKLDPRAQYLMWALVALRLLLPVELAPSAFSAMSLVNRAEERTHLAQSIGQASVPLPGLSYEDAYDQAIREYHQNQPQATSFTDLDQVELRTRELLEHRPTLAELAAKYAQPVWLGGAALMGLWFAVVNLRLRRRLKDALPVDMDPADCPLPVYVTGALPSPCLRGLFRPAIYLTPAALESDGAVISPSGEQPLPARLRHVLTHELTHYRHRDHWWAWVRCLCLCLYWFDPLVWWAAAMSRQDCELACDAGAIRRLGEEERLPYGRTLVDMIAAGRTSLLQTATTMTGSRRRVKERVELIARRPKTAIALALTATLLVGLAVGCTFTGAVELDPEPLSSDGLNTATLPSRLLDVPDELWDHVEAKADNGSVVTYYFKKSGKELDRAQYLLIVNQRSEEDLQRLYDESPYPVGGSRWFAKGSDCYYVFQWNTSIEYEREDEEQFTAAARAVREFAEQTVLDTEGVEPYSPYPQDRLLRLPEELAQQGVTASAAETKLGLNSIPLTSYWWDGATAPESRETPTPAWVLSVYRWERSVLDETGWPEAGDGREEEVVAQSSGYYYTIERPVDLRFQQEDGEDFSARYAAVRDFALAELLDTPGVEAMAAGSDVPAEVAAAVNRLMSAPSVNLTPTYHNGASRFYTTVPSQDAYGVRLTGLLTAYTWEEFDWGTTEDPHFPSYPQDAAGLRVNLPDNSAYLTVWEGSDLMPVHDEANGTSWYYARWAGAGGGPSVYEYLLPWCEDVIARPEQPMASSSEIVLSPVSERYPLDYTLVESYEDLPEDPEQWFLVGQLPGDDPEQINLSPRKRENIYMFARNGGRETMFQIGGRATQVFHLPARLFGGGYTPDGKAPQLMRLEGSRGEHDSFAVITHIYQGGTDCLYRLTVYDMDPKTGPRMRIHDWEYLMRDFNANRAAEVHPDRTSVSITYGGQTLEIPYEADDPLWRSVLDYGFEPTVSEYSMAYTFNDDGTANLLMPIWGPLNYYAGWTANDDGTASLVSPAWDFPCYCACWTILYNDAGIFEATDFQFVLQ